MVAPTKDILRHLQELMTRVDVLEKEVAQKDARIAQLENENKKLQSEVKHLRNIVDKNSSNSSKPPSSDGFKKVIHNGRVKSGKLPGGQLGHKGRFRKLFNNPTETIPLKREFCECGCAIKYSGKKIIKQLADLKMLLDVIEYHSYKGKCPCCKKKYQNEIAGLVNPVTYGNNLKALTVILSAEGCVSVNRIKTFLQETSDGKINISEATIINWLGEMAGKTVDEIKEYKKNLLAGITLHKDETGAKIDKEPHWLHVLCNKNTTLYHMDKNRGNKADEAMGILPVYKGTLVSDHFQALVTLKIARQECNAHIIRYLKAEVEKKRSWAAEMICLLVTAHRETLVTGTKQELPSERISHFEREYDRIIDAGIQEHKSSPERFERTENIKLLERMKEFKTEHLLFLSRAEVPFDNNLAERALRMMKTKAKVSGCFRSETGAQNFAAIKSVLSTTKKRGGNLFQKTKSLFAGV